MTSQPTVATTPPRRGDPTSPLSCSARTPQKFRKRSILRRSAVFKRLVHWAYSVCSGSDETHVAARINRDELYSGILLVHLTLAKFAGPAACYPPTRSMVNELFQLTDTDGSGFINEEEFSEIVVICSANIFSRVVMYYAILILAAPYLAQKHIIPTAIHVDRRIGWDFTKIYTRSRLLTLVSELVTWEVVFTQILVLAVFFLIIPLTFDWIDGRATAAAEKRAKKIAAFKQKVKKHN